jgi:excisionase family DNA binding protein
MTITTAGQPLRRLEDLPDLLTRSEAAEYLGVSPQTLARWAVEGVGPKITRIGRKHVRYAKADVLAFVAQGVA